jgi:phosphoglycolate phosphatase
VAETLDLLRSKARAACAPLPPAAPRGADLRFSVRMGAHACPRQGKRLVFVTNNSTKSRAGYTAKFKSLGLNVTAARLFRAHRSSRRLTRAAQEEIFSSSFAAAAYFESTNFPKDKKARSAFPVLSLTSAAHLSPQVYVVGEVGIQQELDLVGVAHKGGPADASKTIDLAPGAMMHHDPDVAAVVVGFDRHINYYKIQYATLCIRENPGCLFVATNTDAVTHLTDAQEWAGNGSMVGALRGSCQREPIVVGKPAAFMLDYIAKKFSVRPDQMCMVGDRLDTDILFGRDGGLRTLLVLSGVTSEATLLSPDNAIAPDLYADSLADLRGAPVAR